MTGHRITHIRLKHAKKECKSITNVKMDRKSVTVDHIIKMMKGTGRDRIRHTFYIESEGIRVSIKLAPDSNNPTYIRTEQADSPYDTLLELPRF